MRVISGPNVDLITPFPQGEIPRVWGWLQCFKSLCFDDFSPKTRDEFIGFFGESLGRVLSWGVIDKNNRLSMNHPAPLIGVLTFEGASPTNGYMHVASSRKAWGSRMIDEAAKVAIRDVFNSNSTIARVSAVIFAGNYPAQALCRRVGFVREGVFKDMILQNNEPQAIIHYGLYRRSWKE